MRINFRAEKECDTRRRKRNDELYIVEEPRSSEIHSNCQSNLGWKSGEGSHSFKCG